jgi:hypothetical protein|tara:strand:- start:361 stop:558 length:198 start_codon:yes stop_codon:yes gene_type:complete
MLLPNSPVRKIYECHKCGDVSVHFYDPKHNKVFSGEEWKSVMVDGKEALRKIIKPLKEDPKFFTD